MCRERGLLRRIQRISGGLRSQEQVVNRAGSALVPTRQRAQVLEQRWKLDRIAFDREYFVALHLKATLEELVSRLRERLGAM